MLDCKKLKEKMFKLPPKKIPPTRPNTWAILCMILLWMILMVITEKFFS